jgi:hypothetical protein
MKQQYIQVNRFNENTTHLLDLLNSTFVELCKWWYSHVMKSVTKDLRHLFENAYEVGTHVREGDTRHINVLNRELHSKKLGGRLLVLAVPDHPAFSAKQHAHLLPSGRIRGFEVRGDGVDVDPTLVVLMHDIRGPSVETQAVPIFDGIEPYDVAVEQSDSELFKKVTELLRDPQFSFPALANLCKDVAEGNLNLAVFASALNDYLLPYHIASRIYTNPMGVYYYNQGNDVSPPLEDNTGFSLSSRDMFTFKRKAENGDTKIHITNMAPGSPMNSFRDIIIDHDVKGYDLP